jgi:ribosomal-protein-alanine N-acetyltransferase
MSATNVIIRDCIAADLDWICQIELKCHGVDGAITRVGMTQYFDLFASLFIVAEMESAVVGFAVGGIVASTEKRHGWLLDIAVLPHLQGKGIGFEMCKQVVDRLVKFGYGQIRATVAPDNAQSLKLLNRLGFVEVEDVANYFGRNQRRLVMDWNLKGRP